MTGVGFKTAGAIKVTQEHRKDTKRDFLLEPEILNEALKNWGIDLQKVRNDLPLSGSPERSVRRFVIEDKNGLLFVLERIALKKVSRKKEMGSVLRALQHKGLGEIQAYLPTAVGNEQIAVNGNAVHQLSHYVKGEALMRPGYIFDEWRGIALGEFLINLKKASSSGLPLRNIAPFSIFAFIDEMQQKGKRLDPALFKKIDDIIDFLNSDFRVIHDRTPVIFCHGDFHPLNIIWSAAGIAAVIDWEFMGMKPEFYDVANMIGCVGIEDPNGLVGGLTHDFLTTLDSSLFLSPESRKHLPEAVLALRLAWLSVWLAKKDTEMVDIEIRYLRLLYDNIGDLKYSWGC